MTNFTNLAPSQTYGDIITCNNNGGGLTNVLQLIGDGLGNESPLMLSTIAININRLGGNTFQLDGIPLTATATALNNASSVIGPTTPDAIARYNGLGSLINSVVLLSNAGDLTGINSAAIGRLNISAFTIANNNAGGDLFLETTGGGEVQIQTTNGGDVIFQCLDDGNAIFQTLGVGNVALTCQTGDINLNAIIGNINLTGSLAGQVNITTPDIGGITLATNFGNLILNSTGGGNVNLNAALAGQINLTTANGDLSLITTGTGGIRFKANGTGTIGCNTRGFFIAPLVGALTGPLFSISDQTGARLISFVCPNNLPVSTTYVLPANPPPAVGGPYFLTCTQNAPYILSWAVPA